MIEQHIKNIIDGEAVTEYVADFFPINKNTKETNY